MWRKCDLHRHTTPDGQGEFQFDPEDFLLACVNDGLDVVAVTDHDSTDHIDAVMEAAKNRDIIVIPGVEISTDRGHILALAPGAGGRNVLGGVVKRVCSRSSLPGVGKWPGTTPLSWHNGSPLRATA